MRSFGILTLWFLLTFSAAHSASLTGAELFAAKGCHICHGLEGRNPLSDSYPMLAGQNVPYLIQQLVDIKYGRRNNGLSPTMRTTLQFTSVDELRRIANYLGSLPTESAVTLPQ